MTCNKSMSYFNYNRSKARPFFFGLSADNLEVLQTLTPGNSFSPSATLD